MEQLTNGYSRQSRWRRLVISSTPSFPSIDHTFALAMLDCPAAQTRQASIALRGASPRRELTAQSTGPRHISERNPCRDNANRRPAFKSVVGRYRGFYCSLESDVIEVRKCTIKVSLLVGGVKLVIERSVVELSSSSTHDVIQIITNIINIVNINIYL